MSDEPRPGTTASIDRKVEHLAEKVDVLETRMAAVEQNQVHARELQVIQFAAIQSDQRAVLAQLSAISTAQASLDARLNAKDVEAARLMSDPMATPAGQVLMETIKNVIGDVSDIKKKVYMGAGALALITFLTPILGPLIRALLNIP